MKNYIKSAWKILYIYIMADILFIIFVYPFYNASGSRFYTLLPVYSFVFFGIVFLLIFFETKKLAVIEQRPYYNLKPSPFKGFFLGVLAYLPFAFIGILYKLIVFSSEQGERLKHVILNILMGPVYGFVSIGKESPYAYIAAGLTIPIICMLGYMVGFYTAKSNKNNNN